jgi:hypothetical protein
VFPSPPAELALGFLKLFGACLLDNSQLLGVAGPGGGRGPCCGARRERRPALGRGASTSVIFNILRSAGGTVRCVITSVISFLLSGVVRGACSFRSCCMRWFTVWGSVAPAEDEARELWREGWTYDGFVCVKLGACFFGIVCEAGRVRAHVETGGRLLGS